MKRVSDAYGGDDIEFLKKCCRETLESHPGCKIEDAIIIYTEILENIWLPLNQTILM